MLNREGDLRGFLSNGEKRQIALRRSRQLRERIANYLEEQPNIPTGFNREEVTERNRRRILGVLGGSEEDWANWKWQMANRITEVGVLAEILDLSRIEQEQIRRVGERFRWAISPYYASLIDLDDPESPVRRQAVPSILELDTSVGESDPMAEEFTSPAPCITRRYPDRLIINVTNRCAMYCRHCQRRRNIGEVDKNKSRVELEAALDYIRANPEIRDVLLTGGDALMLSDRQIDWLLGELDAIPHVEIKRIGTRVPVTLPQRITPELCAILEAHPPLYLNTQFNHPREVTPAAARATAMLARAGVVLGNQAVLLKGVNSHPFVMKKLNQELLKIRVRPYYIFHAKQVSGTAHFITSVDEGLEIMEQLRGYTSGLAVPTYIINAPRGYGKVPVLPEYLLERDSGKVVIRTWEKRVLAYPNGVRRRQK
ncbi:MAG: glutamate 2,3-aminomutase [Clostridia bacterium]|nr:MAG: glutamate 2,3-aminomutase [Clostridia bacterium]